MSEQTTQNKTEFNIKINQPTLKQVLEGINSLVDQCTFNIDPEGISCKVLDIEHVCLINVSIPNGMFEKYEVVKQGLFSFNLDDALKIIDDIPKESMIRILNDDKDLILQANNTTYYLKLNDTIDSNTPLPRTPYDSTIELDDSFTKYITRLSKFGKYFLIESTNSILKLSSKNESGKITTIIKLEKGMEELINISCKNGSNECIYSMKYILPYLKTIPKGIHQQIQFSNARPLRHQVKLSNFGGFIDFYLAPRVEN